MTALDNPWMARPPAELLGSGSLLLALLAQHAGSSEFSLWPLDLPAGDIKAAPSSLQWTSLAALGRAHLPFLSVHPAGFWGEPSHSPGWGFSGVHLGGARASWFRVKMWEQREWTLIRAVCGSQQHTWEVRVSGGWLAGGLCLYPSS